MTRPITDRNSVRALFVVAAIAFGTGSDCLGDGPRPTSNRTITATIDGSLWSAAESITGSYTDGRLTLTGQNTGGESIEITVTTSTTGTFVIGGFGGGSLTFILTDTRTARSWRAFTANGSGTLTLSAISATRAVGTFSFTALPTPASGAVGNRVVAAGMFDVTF